MPSASRRGFLAEAAATITTGVAALSIPGARSAAADSVEPVELQELSVRSPRKRRQLEAFRVRVQAARAELARPAANHPTNGDDERYPTKIASYTKGLPHDHLGEVDLDAYGSLTRALRTGRVVDFERIVLGDDRARLVNPQAGLAFELHGPDSHSLTMRAAPAFSSAEEAADIAENYWMALLRDVPLSEYEVHPLAHQAAADLSRFSDFRAPHTGPGGSVSPATLFRGGTPGDLTGPYVSQFLWQDTPFGAERVVRSMQTAVSGIDYLTRYEDWLAVQNGAPQAPGEHDPIPRYIRNGRDLGEWVHVDVLFQAYFNALLILLSRGAPFDRGNPYVGSRTQIGFGTLGAPYIASVLCAVATRALKAVWFQKWLVHRRLRPEVFAARIHNHLHGAASYPIHPEILHSAAVAEVRARTGSFLLPMAFPEGSPLHPSYGAGHATVGGACVTVLKAFFDEAFVLPDPVEASADGLSLIPYTGSDLTAGGELNKLASNVALGRNIAGVHWRSDASESLRLGEEVAIRFLIEERVTFNERFGGYSLTRFDGTTITV